jgi:hypothetical protein
MQQSKIESLIEVCINVAVGWVIALMTQLIVFPMFGIQVTLGEQLSISVIFTVVSIIRGYVIRRWFNARIHNAVINISKKVV